MYNDILQDTIDLHVHVGPEIIPRKYSVETLVKAEQGKLKGFGIKNHFFPTAAMHPVGATVPLVIDSIALNHFVGGFNASAVQASADLSGNPLIVWFPTVHAENTLRQQKTEIPAEWLSPEARTKVTLRDASSLAGLRIEDEDGNIRRDVLEVLEVIKQKNAILATGHLSWKESQKLVTFAMQNLGITRVIVTHPIYQKIAMPLEIQRELAGMGAYMEQCYSMYSIDKIPVKEISRQIEVVGPERCILSSDVGQAFSPPPSEALAIFFGLLAQEGIDTQSLRTMAAENPAQLIGL